MLDTMTVVPAEKSYRYEEENGMLLQQEFEGEEAWSASQQEKAEQMENTGSTSQKEPVLWTANEKLQILTDRGRLLVPEEQFLLQKTRLVGKRLPELRKQEKVVGAIEYDPMWEAWVLSPNGILYRVPRGTGLCGNDFCSSDNELHIALREGGMFFQNTRDDWDRQSVVCLADTGRIRRISTLHLKRIPDTGRQLVRLETGETLVSACMCGEESGLLIISQKGKALYIERQELKTILRIGAHLYEGMRLHGDDRAVACISYEKGKDILIVTRNGKALRLQHEFEIVPHKRGSSGATTVRLDEGDQVLTVMHAPNSAMLLLSKEGRSLCVNTNEIPAVRSAAKGVRTMNLSPGQAVTAVVPMQFVNGGRGED